MTDQEKKHDGAESGFNFASDLSGNFTQTQQIFLGFPD